MTGAPLLSVENLSIGLPKGSDRPHAIENVNFSIGSNEILCIVGESGSGKSVSALAIMGLLPSGIRATAGRIQFRDRNLLELSPRDMRGVRGREISMVFQEPMTSLNPVLRIGPQMLEHLMAHGGIARRQAMERIHDLLERVGIMEPRRIAESYPYRLSGGQRQRVMIAMALSLRPTLLIADEPTTALDVTTQAQILSLIKSMQQDYGMGVLYITHDFGVVAEIADRVAVMEKGALVEIGTAAEVLKSPRHAYTQALIASVPTLSAAHRVTDERQPEVLRVIELRKTYATPQGLLAPPRRVDAVDQVSLSIRRGETLGLVGESGSGKSTLARCVIRLLDIDGGSILFDGEDIGALSQKALRVHRKRIQMVFQDPFASLNPRHRVRAILTRASRAHGIGRREADDKAAELLGLVGLGSAALDRFPHEFSGGQRQRIGIARALMLDPSVLVADEPVSALDVSVQAQVLKLLDDVRQRLDLAMLFITHDLRVAAQVCHRVAVMNRGKIVEIGATAEIFGNPQHAYTRELLASVPGKEWLGRFGGT